LLFILWFFVVYPVLRARSGLTLRPPEGMRSSKIELAYGGIQGIAETVKQSFVFISRYRRMVFSLVVFGGGALAALVILTSFDVVQGDFKWKPNPFMPWFVQVFQQVVWTLHNTGTLYQSGASWIMIGGTAVCLAAIMFLTTSKLSMGMTVAKRSGASTVLACMLFGILAVLPLLIAWPFGLIIGLLFFPLAAVVTASFLLRTNHGDPWGLRILSRQLGNVFGLGAFLSLLVLIIFVLINTPLLNILSGLLEWVFNIGSGPYSEQFVLLVTTLSIISIVFGYVLLTVGCCLQYFTLREIQFAPELGKRVEAFGAQTSPTL
jgi:hypothetical protein